MSDRVEAPNSNVVAKAGLWYTICNFLFKGAVFITTPIFTRLLTQNQIGDFSNYTSWVSILIVITSFDIQSSIIRSKLEYEEDLDCYIFSILSLTSIVTLLFYGMILMFPDAFSSFFKIEMKYIHIMFLYLLFTPAYQMLITKHRAFYKYKTFVMLTGITILSSTFLSLAMVLLMEDKYAGRLIGNFLPYIIVGIIIYLYLWKKGKKIKIKYWKYASEICLPLVPHVLSLYLLSSSDKIIITKICGSQLTSIYAIAYSCYNIVTLLFNSLNNAWAPWLLDNLHYENYENIKKTSKRYIGIFLILIIGILLLVPEIIYILGGSEYHSAIYCLPPLITACIFQFIYTMYVNIEFYEKKTIGVSVATMIATVVNIILNFLLIPLDINNGHIIASYTTLLGYILLFFLHYYLVKKMHMNNIYDTKFISTVLIIALILMLMMNLIYSILFLRFLILSIYFIAIIIFIFKNKKVLIKLFKI